MVDGVINWATLAGVLLVLAGLPLAGAGAVQLVLQLGRRRQLSDQLVSLVVLQALCLVLRLLLPAVGAVLVLNGWRLEAQLQWAVAVLALSAFLEVGVGTLRDLQLWQRRRPLRPRPGGSGGPSDRAG
jgi:hypothetical protein